MDFAALKAFLTVVEEGSFSKASTRLFRTQPAVSLAVRRLEEDLGERLIDRSSRQMVLTDAGRATLEYGRRFENLRREWLAALEDLHNLDAGRLTIGANESSTLYLLRHLRDFRERHPKIQVQVQRRRSSRIPELLLNGDLELGVISYDPANPQIASRVIYTDHLAFIVSPRHRLAGRQSVPIGELAMETFIAHNVVSPYREIVLRAFEERQVPLNRHVEMPTIETIRRLVQRDLGVTFLPRMCVDQEIRQGTLCEIQVPELQMEREIRLVHHRRRTLSRAARAFLDLLVETPVEGEEAGPPPVS